MSFVLYPLVSRRYGKGSLIFPSGKTLSNEIFLLEDIRLKLFKPGPYPEDPMLQMWVGGELVLQRYIKSLMLGKISGPSFHPLSWAHSKSVANAHCMFMLERQLGKDTAIIQYKHMNGGDATLPNMSRLYPRNMNRGKSAQ